MRGSKRKTDPLFLFFVNVPMVGYLSKTAVPFPYSFIYVIILFPFQNQSFKLISTSFFKQALSGNYISPKVFRYTPHITYQYGTLTTI